MSKKKKYHGTFAFKTDRGRVRLANEDQARVLFSSSEEVLLIVCDGMGGANKGDYASKIALDTFVDAFREFPGKRGALLTKNWMCRVAKTANRRIYDEASSNPIYEGMGTTLVAVYILGRKMVVLNIGDSRAYAMGAKGFRRITNDQTYVEYLVNSGKIKEEETNTHPGRHVLMNALGIFPSLSYEAETLDYEGESILLCSDGLYNNMSEAEIEMILSTDERVDQKVYTLISEANANGGSDNIGIAYWESVND